MKKWQLQEAKKNLEKIIKNVLSGEIQGIMTANGEVVYLVPGEKNNMIAEPPKVVYQANTDLITYEIGK
ncbi:type II toxin-antitoxin system Phd/YefM family antitoxin [Rickettsia parkeri]|uniref:type II toxin-antitoxin system prevent-host-death family antitoxin n=1 Tax=Rickettsia parkeri TaxID=35792 RepID=UPI0010FC378A|nr:type II toxin-antitoxin system prevent-host-death family antitoxin [Rickettsia parkeri]QCS24399.1 type II toxin-antitoxin system Phd/YefM family antitoxin [Rickettsia parkeri]QWB86732.1 hypothetical protein JRD95_00786 [Rickettsia parkeri]